MPRSLVAWSLALGALGALAAAAPPVRADTPSGSAIKEAGKHFQRGVALYNEADYRAALVEFQRAYDTAPNAAVLYNLGQTYYQLQNYAMALTALERYLAESASTAAHRGEVEQTLEVLRARVGRIRIATRAAACEITIDDELVGKTPLDHPALVSIGRRKVTALCAGAPPETRFVDVAAGDTIDVALRGEAAARPLAAPASPGGWTRRDLARSGWIATGVLGAGAITTGVLAYLASRDLDDARGRFPVSASDLDHKSSRVATLSLVADVLGATAIVTGVLSWRLGRSSGGEVRVGVAHNAVQFSGSF